MLTFNQKLALKEQMERSTMQPAALKLDKWEARNLYKKYKSATVYQKPEKIDLEVMRTYRMISEGKVIIQALESIRQAGAQESGLPKLALMRADQEKCFVEVTPDGRVRYRPQQWRWQKGTRAASLNFSLPAGTMPGKSTAMEGSCLLPTIPFHLKPKRGLENYHILWEAEWKKIPPGDPLLLQQIGIGDMWLVVAAWDLTEVEKAAMRTRIFSA